jgi:hypothetical protein
MSKLAATIITGLIIATGVSACGNDATVSNRVTGSAEKINMPDQFDTIADRCDGHGFRVYENGGSEGTAIAVVRDPKCDGTTR